MTDAEVWLLINAAIEAAVTRFGATRLTVAQALLGIGIFELSAAIGKAQTAAVLKGLTETAEMEAGCLGSMVRH